MIESDTPNVVKVPGGPYVELANQIRKAYHALWPQDDTDMNVLGMLKKIIARASQV